MTAKRDSDLSITSMTKLEDTKYCYQLIKTITKFEKGSRHWWYVFIKKNLVNLVKCKTSSVHLLRQECVNCPITSMTRTLAVPLVLKSGSWYSIMFQNVVIVLINSVKRSRSQQHKLKWTNLASLKTLTGLRRIIQSVESLNWITKEQ